MKTYLHHEGIRFSIDSRRAFTHVVLTRENKEPLIPEGRRLTHAEITAHPESARLMDELTKFATEEVAGRFALKPAEWAESLDEAEQIAAANREEKLEDGTTPKWSEVVVKPVGGRLKHA